MKARDAIKTDDWKHAYNKRYYSENRSKENSWRCANRRKVIALIKQYLTAYLEAHPCVDCMEKDTIVLQFDHRDTSTKLFTMAEARRGRHKLTEVIEEVQKCDIRCANCHHRRTQRQIANGEIKTC